MVAAQHLHRVRAGSQVSEPVGDVFHAIRYECGIPPGRGEQLDYRR